MKNLILIICLLFMFIVCKAQKNESDKLYWVALEKYTAALDTFRSKRTDGLEDKVIYLEKPSFIDSIPPQMNGYQIVLMDYANMWKIYLAHKKKLVHTNIFPLRLEKDIIKITIIPYGGTMKNRHHIDKGVSDGTTVYFKFNCDKGLFEYYKTNNWGI